MAGKLFDLMHKDNPVASVRIDGLSGFILSARITEPELLPLGPSCDTELLRKWWMRRATPISQANFRSALMKQQIHTSQSLLLRCFGLSLNDHYWIRPAGSDLTWSDVSLFSNPFVNAEKNFAPSVIPDFSKHPLMALSPSGSMNGEMQKKWVIEQDKRRLLKRGSGTSQQAVNEHFASMIHARQGKFPFVQYDLVHFNGGMGTQIGCICDCFATEELEFIPAIDVIESQKKRNDLSYFQHFINLCGHNGLDTEAVRAFLEYQILSDFVITNVDRHFYNFGVLRDSDSLRYVGMAPIFDSGNSLFWENPKGAGKIDLLNVSVNSFRNTELGLLSYISHPELLDLDKLPSPSELQSLMEESELDYGDRIAQAYRQKIALTEQLQHGVPLRSVSPDKAHGLSRRLKDAQIAAGKRNAEASPSHPIKHMEKQH